MVVSIVPQTKGLAQTVADLRTRFDAFQDEYSGTMPPVDSSFSELRSEFDAFKTSMSEEVQKLRDELSETNAQLMGLSIQQTKDEQTAASHGVGAVEDQH